MSTTIILQGSGFPEFTSGRLEIERPFMLTIWASNPVTPGYLDVFDPRTYSGDLPVGLFKRIDFTGGELDLYVPTARNIVLGHGETTFSAGTISIGDSQLPDTGALTEFAAWPLANKDPNEFYLTAVSAANSGAVGAAWTRHNAVFAVGRGIRGLQRVAYIGVGSKFISQPASGKQYLSEVMVEQAPLSASLPSAYAKAREVQTVVHPDRLNWSPNPGFEVNTNNYAATGAGVVLSRVAMAVLPGSSWAGQVACPTAVACSLRPTLLNLIVGNVYTLSIYVLTDAPTQAISLSIFSGGNQLYSTDYPDAPVSVGGFRRMSATFVATSSTVVQRILLPALTGGYNVWADNALVEDGYDVKPYFDGSAFYGGDTLWETGGSASNTRSYYYKNRAERFAAVKKILAQNVPMGIGIADPQFAVLPVE